MASWQNVAFCLFFFFFLKIFLKKKLCFVCNSLMLALASLRMKPVSGAGTVQAQKRAEALQRQKRKAQKDQWVEDGWFRYDAKTHWLRLNATPESKSMCSACVNF
jgi:hypothetical protein